MTGPLGAPGPSFPVRVPLGAVLQESTNAAAVPGALRGLVGDLFGGDGDCMNKKILGRVLLGTLLPVLLITGVVIGQNQFGAPKTVVHVVTVKWKKESTAQQRQEAIEGVRVMAGKIPGIRNVWIKTLKVQGPSADMPFDAAFVMEFADEAALKAYADHPAHRQWESIYIPIRESSRTHDITN